MPQIAEILTETLEGVVKATDAQERKRLQQHITAVKKLGGKQPGVDELLDLVGDGEDGYLPHYAHAAKVTIDASLAMSTTRERKVDADGGVVFGPVEIRGGLSNTFGQQTGTNVAVSIEVERLLVSQVFKELQDSFGL